jgi:hypothetical protein
MYSGSQFTSKKSSKKVDFTESNLSPECGSTLQFQEKNYNKSSRESISAKKATRTKKTKYIQFEEEL